MIHASEFITLDAVQLWFRGPSEYNNEMLEKLRRETQIQFEDLTSHCYIMRVHVAEQCYVGMKDPKTILKGIQSG